MGFPTTLHPALHHSSSCFFRQYYVGLSWKQQRLALLSSFNRRHQSLQCTKSIANNRKQHVNGNGAAETTRLLLERLFMQTQKMEEQMRKGSSSLSEDDVHLELLSLETLESDLKAAFAVLKEKEENLEEAGRKVILERNELSRAKEELVQREEWIASAFIKQEKLEEELKKANSTLASQAREIEELKLLVHDKEHEILAAQSALSLKEDELEKMKLELAKKTEDASRFEFELNLKAQTLKEANEVIKRQGLEIQGLQREIFEKEQELEISLTLRKGDEEKLTVAETKLEKQTTGWLLARGELKSLAEEASRRSKEESDEMLEEFGRVKKLLVDVRSELMSSQTSLASSRRKMEEQEKLLEKQLAELEEQKEGIVSYMASLKDAQVEVESERVKLRVAEARNRELERDLSLERELIESLRLELTKEKDSLQETLKEMSFLRGELDRKNSEFGETQKLLEAKEAELVEANMEIRQLKSERDGLRLVLEERDLELVNAKNSLDEVSREVGELKVLLEGKENELVRATKMLKEKEGHVNSIDHELSDTKLRVAEAESVVEHIVELTNKLVISMDGEERGDSVVVMEPPDNSRWRLRQLEAELGLTRQSLREKEMELLASERALAVKNEELKTVLEKLTERGEELKRLKDEMKDEEADELKRLYEDKTLGDVVIERLQLEAAQLEVEAATNALQKLAEMSRDLLGKASLCMEVGFDTTGILHSNEECLSEVKAQVARLSYLSEQLVREAGIVDVGTE